jgi:hypothetical protein
MIAWVKFASVGLTPAEEEQAEQHAAERDLVDERGGGRVEQRPGVRPGIGKADAVVAVRRDARRDEDADEAVRDAAEHRLEAIPGAEIQVALRRGVDVQDRDRRARTRARTRRSVGRKRGCSPSRVAS